MTRDIIRAGLYSAALIALAASGPAGAQPIISNGDFSAGFTDWEGQADFSTVTPSAPNFVVSGGAALLTTSYGTAGPGPFALALFQSFDVPVSTADVFQLSFDATWTSDDPSDLWLAQLIDNADQTHYLDLTSRAIASNLANISAI